MRWFTLRIASLKRKLSKLWQTSWKERWLMVQALMLLPVIALSLAVFGLQTTQRHLTWLSPVAVAASPAESMAEALCMAQCVNRAANHSPLWGNCLKRSLTLWFLLRRRGMISDLRIGVRRHLGEFQAHAWIEYGGQVLNDRATVHQLYTAFDKPFEVNVISS